MNFYMWWWKGKNNMPNFGDALNPYLITKLGDKVSIKYVSRRPYKECLIFVLSALKHRKKPDEGRLRKLYRFNHFALCIGSILKDALPGQIIWGSGFMNYNETIKGGKLLAVRGYKTIKELKNHNVVPPKVVGDPALLLPLVFKPHIFPQYELGIIPHIIDYQTLHKSTKLPIINLKSNEIEDVIEQICKCKFILSTSLHGLIVSHAYGIPALWIKNEDIGTDGFKFHDYFSSVGLPIYQPIKCKDINQFDFSKLEQYKDVSLPKMQTIKEIQQKLLSVAPFPLKKEFK